MAQIWEYRKTWIGSGWTGTGWEREGFLLRNGLMGLKFLGQAGRLETGAAEFFLTQETDFAPMTFN